MTRAHTDQESVKPDFTKHIAHASGDALNVAMLMLCFTITCFFFFFSNMVSDIVFYAWAFVIIGSCMILFLVTLGTRVYSMFKHGSLNDVCTHICELSISMFSKTAFFQAACHEVKLAADIIFSTTEHALQLIFDILIFPITVLLGYCAYYYATGRVGRVRTSAVDTDEILRVWLFNATVCFIIFIMAAVHANGYCRFRRQTGLTFDVTTAAQLPGKCSKKKNMKEATYEPDFAVTALLKELGLGRHQALLDKNEFELDSLEISTVADLEEIGLPHAAAIAIVAHFNPTWDPAPDEPKTAFCHLPCHVVSITAMRIAALEIVFNLLVFSITVLLGYHAYEYAAECVGRVHTSALNIDEILRVWLSIYLIYFILTAANCFMFYIMTSRYADGYSCFRSQAQEADIYVYSHDVRKRRQKTSKALFTEQFDERTVSKARGSKKLVGETTSRKKTKQHAKFGYLARAKQAPVSRTGQVYRRARRVDMVVGQRIYCLWGGDGQHYGAFIKKVNADHTYALAYDDGVNDPSQPRLFTHVRLKDLTGISDFDTMGCIGALLGAVFICVVFVFCRGYAFLCFCVDYFVKVLYRGFYWIRSPGHSAPQARPQIQIFLHTHRHLPAHVSPDTTILDLKLYAAASMSVRAAAASMSVRADQLRAVFHGRELRDERTIQFYDVQKEQTVYFSKRLVGGMKASASTGTESVGTSNMDTLLYMDAAVEDDMMREIQPRGLQEHKASLRIKAIEAQKAQSSDYRAAVMMRWHKDILRQERNEGTATPENMSRADFDCNFCDELTARSMAFNTFACFGYGYARAPNGGNWSHSGSQGCCVPKEGDLESHRTLATAVYSCTLTLRRLSSKGVPGFSAEHLRQTLSKLNVDTSSTVEDGEEGGAIERFINLCAAYHDKILLLDDEALWQIPVPVSNSHVEDGTLAEYADLSLIDPKDLHDHLVVENWEGDRYRVADFNWFEGQDEQACSVNQQLIHNCAAEWFDARKNVIDADGNGANAQTVSNLVQSVSNIRVYSTHCKNMSKSKCFATFLTVIMLYSGDRFGEGAAPVINVLPTFDSYDRFREALGKFVRVNTDGFCVHEKDGLRMVFTQVTQAHARLFLGTLRQHSKSTRVKLGLNNTKKENALQGKGVGKKNEIRLTAKTIQGYKSAIIALFQQLDFPAHENPFLGEDMNLLLNGWTKEDIRDGIDPHSATPYPFLFYLATRQLSLERVYTADPAFAHNDLVVATTAATDGAGADADADAAGDGGVRSDQLPDWEDLVEPTLANIQGGLAIMNDWIREGLDKQLGFEMALCNRSVAAFRADAQAAKAERDELDWQLYVATAMGAGEGLADWEERQIVFNKRTSRALAEALAEGISQIYDVDLTGLNIIVSHEEVHTHKNGHFVIGRNPDGKTWDLNSNSNSGVIVFSKLNYTKVYAYAFRHFGGAAGVRQAAAAAAAARGRDTNAGYDAAGKRKRGSKQARRGTTKQGAESSPAPVDITGLNITVLNQVGVPNGNFVIARNADGKTWDLNGNNGVNIAGLDYTKVYAYAKKKYRDDEGVRQAADAAAADRGLNPGDDAGDGTTNDAESSPANIRGELTVDAAGDSDGTADGSGDADAAGDGGRVGEGGSHLVMLTLSLLWDIYLNCIKGLEICGGDRGGDTIHSWDGDFVYEQSVAFGTGYRVELSTSKHAGTVRSKDQTTTRTSSFFRCEGKCKYCVLTKPIENIPTETVGNIAVGSYTCVACDIHRQKCLLRQFWSDKLSQSLDPKKFFPVFQKCRNKNGVVKDGNIEFKTSQKKQVFEDSWPARELDFQLVKEAHATNRSVGTTIPANEMTRHALKIGAAFHACDHQLNIKEMMHLMNHKTIKMAMQYARKVVADTSHIYDTVQGLPGQVPSTNSLLQKIETLETSQALLSEVVGKMDSKITQLVSEQTNLVACVMKLLAPDAPAVTPVAGGATAAAAMAAATAAAPVAAAPAAAAPVEPVEPAAPAAAPAMSKKTWECYHPFCNKTFGSESGRNTHMSYSKEYERTHWHRLSVCSSSGSPSYRGLTVEGKNATDALLTNAFGGCRHVNPDDFYYWHFKDTKGASGGKAKNKAKKQKAAEGRVSRMSTIPSTAKTLKALQCANSTCRQTFGKCKCNTAKT